MGNKRTLWFEGAGCVERGDVENCRIQTAFRNDEGKAFYLELSGIEVTKNVASSLYIFKNAGFVDYCYELGEEGGKFSADIEKKHFEYCKAEILKFVNQNMGCSFEEIRVTDSFFGYRVHKDGGGYNLMDDFTFDDEKASKARKTFEYIDTKIRVQLCERYSKISLMGINEDSISVRCYASDKSMREHGMNPEERILTVKFDEAE